ncbi:MAG: outer membrane homotrimeric porin [Desulfovibrionaceae bacterium]|nr:outer membrane homotrimeric porin [Desulfovibrionaceae bacterium]MBF0513849.1 outer membrane homotrimeric porin [Desulfovibrionaceae bacterium]
MKRFTLIALAFVFVLGLAVAANADTEVKMMGDARIHANLRTNFNFTPWNARGMNYFTGAPNAAVAGVAPATASEETFTIWERFRLQTDFIASEALKFRLGIRVNNASWGNTLAVDNPPVAIDVNAAYVQFLLPTTEVQVTAGWMPLALPQSKIFNGGIVLDTQGGNTAAAALVVDVPVVKDTFAIKAGYTRLLSGGADFYPGGGGLGGNATTYIPDSLDAFFLAFPITVDGFQAIPWGTVAFAGRMANYTEGFANIGGTSTAAGNYGPYDGALAPNLLSAQSVAAFALSGQNSMWKNSQNTYYWAGLPLNITALDPVNIYADVIYGAGAQSDAARFQRSGWFLDAGLEYAGLDFMKPQLMGWWSTGETSFSQGSQRMPVVRQYWSPGASFLYQTGGSSFTRSTLLANPLGSWGLAFSLKDITFMKDLSHTLTAALANGTNSPNYVRTVNAMAGGVLGGEYFVMGKDLTTDEWLFGLNLDTKYMIYENLSAILELGWAEVSGLRGSVWGARNVNNYGDAWKLAFGFKYTF